MLRFLVFCASVTASVAPSCATRHDTHPASPATCEPDASGWQQSPFVPPEAPSSTCSDDDIDGYFHACLDPATTIPITCQQFVANHSGCATCLLDEHTTSTASALLEKPGAVSPNVGGCIALILGDESDNGCGAREQAAIDCTSFACGGCADPTCRQRATQTVCSDVQQRRCGELAGAAICLPGRGDADDFRRVAKTFCAAAH